MTKLKSGLSPSSLKFIIVVDSLAFCYGDRYIVTHCIKLNRIKNLSLVFFSVAHTFTRINEKIRNCSSRIMHALNLFHLIKFYLFRGRFYIGKKKVSFVVQFFLFFFSSFLYCFSCWWTTLFFCPRQTNYIVSRN